MTVSYDGNCVYIARRDQNVGVSKQWMQPVGTA